MENKGVVLLLKAPKETEEDHFVETLEHAGYQAILVPVLAFNFVNQQRLGQCLQRCQQYSGIIFTSPRAVHAVSRVLAGIGSANLSAQDPCSLRCFVVGQATYDAAKQANFSPEGAGTGNAELLSKFILNAVSRDERRPLLYPSAQMRRDTLLERLHSGDCAVEETVAYETVPSTTILKDITKVFSDEIPPNTVVFFSPSGVQFTEGCVKNGVLPLKSLKVYAIGPTTEQAITSRGYTLAGVAEKPDPVSLLKVLEQGQIVGKKLSP